VERSKRSSLWTSVEAQLSIRDPDVDPGSDVRGRPAGLFPRPRVKLTSITPGNVIQIAALLVVGIGGLKLLRLSNGDAQLASGILEQSGYTAPVAHILISLVPGAALLAVPMMLSYHDASRVAAVLPNETPAAHHSWLFAALLSILFILFVFAPWYYFPIAVAVILAHLILLRRWRKGRSSQEQPSRLARVSQIRAQLLFMVVVLVGMLTLTQITADSPWKPSELVYTTDGSVFHGVVLRHDERWLVVLVNEPRYLEYLPITSVEHRETCRPAGHSATLLQLWRQDGFPGGAACDSQGTPPA
jgi:hypothetical protein